MKPTQKEFVAFYNQHPEIDLGVIVGRYAFLDKVYYVEMGEPTDKVVDPEEVDMSEEDYNAVLLLYRTFERGLLTGLLQQLNAFETNPSQSRLVLPKDGLTN